MEQMTFLDFFAGIGGFRKGFELCGMRCVGPVSYTHLDVYKRQRYDFDNTQVYKETDGAVSPFQITAVAWGGYQLTADHRCV